MSNKPLVAFVILAWNSEKYIKLCIDSILSCDGIRSSILVIDNGSSDSTSTILKKLVNENDQINCIFLDENLGTTVSRNIALKSLTGCNNEHICILDSDTIVNEEALLRLVCVLDSDPSIGVVGPTMSSSSGVEQLSGRNLPTLGIKLAKALPFSAAQTKGMQLEKPRSPIVNNLQDVPYLISACWLVPFRVFETVGLFDENIFYAPEDVDWCLRASYAGYRVVRCWDAHIVHEYQRISKKKFFSKTNFEHLKGLVYFFRKYGYIITPRLSSQSRTCDTEVFYQRSI